MRLLAAIPLLCVAQDDHSGLLQSELLKKFNNDVDCASGKCHPKTPDIKQVVTTIPGRMLDGDDDADEAGCAAHTNNIICPGLKLLCANGFITSANVTKDDVAAGVVALGDDGSIGQAITVPFSQDLQVLDITTPSFKDTQSTVLAHKWTYGLIDPVSRSFNTSKWNILASFAKDGRIGLDELSQAEETMFAEFRKDEAAGKLHPYRPEHNMVPELANPLLFELLGTLDPDTGVKSVKVSELRDVYSAGKLPEDWTKQSTSWNSPTMAAAFLAHKARMQRGYPAQ